jgi:WD40 repeat protein
VSTDNTVLLWDESGPKPIKELKGTAKSIWFLSFSNDGKTLYAADRRGRNDDANRAPGYTSWDVASGAITADYAAWRQSYGIGVQHGVISPDGRFAAFGNAVGIGPTGAISIFSLQSSK